MSVRILAGEDHGGRWSTDGITLAPPVGERQQLSDSAAIAALVEAVRSSVGNHPVVVLGSRALGNATPESDLDAYVVLPGWRVPREIGRLREVRLRLERELRIPVSLNPLPRSRLHRTRGAMLPFKLRREGLVAWSPVKWSLDRGGCPPVDSAARRSYAMSGILFLLEAAEPIVRGAAQLSRAQARGTAKALLHAAQLALADRGDWASRLPDAAARLGGEWPELAAATESPTVWLATRDMLLGPASGHRETYREALTLRLQWAALCTLRGAPAMPPLDGPSPAAALARAACELAAAVDAGHLDLRNVARARAALPGRLRRGAPRDWYALRSLVIAGWPNASPLAGF